MTRRQRFILLVGCTLVLQTAVFAQLPTSSSQPGAGTRRAYTLFGDLKVDESQADKPVNAIFDVILYTRGNEMFSRQRVGNGGRYRFNNIYNGDYYLVVELESVEVARMPIMVSANSVELIRQDLEFRWKGSPAANAAGVISAADNYDRSGKNKSLFERAQKEIKNKNFTQAISTLQSLVEADPKDYPAWSELGMAQFLEKNLDAAETSYNKAIEQKPDHVMSLVSLGRVRLAKKNNEGALQVLEAAVKADPKSAQANYFMGEAYLAVRKGSLAVNYLNEAIKLDPMGMADAHLRLGALYNGAGYKDRAALEYNEFLKKKPDYPGAQKLRDYIMENGPRAKPTEAPSPSPSPKP